MCVCVCSVMVCLWWCVCGGVSVVGCLWWCVCGGVSVVVCLWCCVCGRLSAGSSLVSSVCMCVVWRVGLLVAACLLCVCVFVYLCMWVLSSVFQVAPCGPLLLPFARSPWYFFLSCAIFGCRPLLAELQCCGARSRAKKEPQLSLANWSGRRKARNERNERPRRPSLVLMDRRARLCEGVCMCVYALPSVV